jgi:hypothetical protein
MRVLTSDVTNTVLLQKRLDEVEKARPLRKDNALFVPLDPLQYLEKHTNLSADRMTRCVRL